MAERVSSVFGGKTTDQTESSQSRLVVELLNFIILFVFSFVIKFQTPLFMVGSKFRIYSLFELAAKYLEFGK